MIRNLLIQAHLMVCACALSSFAGCERETASEVAEPAAQRNVRIISLSPAISRTLVDFDLQQQIVGRTPHCDSIDQSIPVAGDLLNLDLERMVKLAPTHILVQPPQEGVDSVLFELAGKHDWTIGQWRLNTIDDVEQMIRELPGVLFDDHDARFASSINHSKRIIDEIATALSPAPQPFRGRTLIVGGVEPVMIFGVDTYLHDVLSGLGGVNAASASGWAMFSLEDVVKLDPDAVIIVAPGSRLDRDVKSLAGPLGKLQIAAARNGRIAVLRNPDAYIPSSGVAGVARDLREILQTFAAGDSR